MERSWRPPAFAGSIGCARREITPPLGIRARNWGASRHERAAGIHRPLTLTALALGELYLVTADLGWWRSAADERRVRDRVRAELGTDEGHLLIHLVHTHAGPTLSTAEASLEGGELIAPYLDHLAETIVDACREAAGAATACVAEWTTGACGLAVNRDLTCDGRSLVAFNPDEPADDTVLVGRITASDGRTVATVVNYACHPTTLGWGCDLLSPDWIGAARQTVEDATNAPCLMLQGASGELSPREQYGADVELADKHGRAVGLAALSALETMPEPGHRLALTGVVESGAALGLWTPEPAPAPSTVEATQLHVDIAAQPLLTPEELNERWASIDPTAAAERTRRAQQLRAGYVDADGRARHPVWVWRLGDAAIVAHPGEAYSYLQTELRRRHPERAIVVLNCTNGPGFVYLPTQDAFEQNVYQSWQTVLKPGCLEAVVEAADAALR